MKRSLDFIIENWHCRTGNAAASYGLRDGGNVVTQFVLQNVTKRVTVYITFYQTDPSYGPDYSFDAADQRHYVWMFPHWSQLAQASASLQLSAQHSLGVAVHFGLDGGCDFVELYHDVVNTVDAPKKRVPQRKLLSRAGRSKR